MMEFVATNWGGVASAVGLVVSTVGLVWAIIVARGARSASRAAQKASQETTAYIAQHLQATNLERSIALIQILKLMHRNDLWEAALEQYQSLRRMLSEIATRLPETETESRLALTTAIRRIIATENEVEARPVSGLQPKNKAKLQRRLNDIQSRLELLAGERGFGDP